MEAIWALHPKGSLCLACCPLVILEAVQEWGEVWCHPFLIQCEGVLDTKLELQSTIWKTVWSAQRPSLPPSCSCTEKAGTWAPPKRVQVVVLRSGFLHASPYGPGLSSHYTSNCSGLLPPPRLPHLSLTWPLHLIPQRIFISNHMASRISHMASRISQMEPSKESRPARPRSLYLRETRQWVHAVVSPCCCEKTLTESSLPKERFTSALTSGWGNSGYDLRQELGAETEGTLTVLTNSICKRDRVERVALSQK